MASLSTFPLTYVPSPTSASAAGDKLSAYPLTYVSYTPSATPNIASQNPDAAATSIRHLGSGAIAGVVFTLAIVTALLLFAAIKVFKRTRTGRHQHLEGNRTVWDAMKELGYGDEKAFARFDEEAEIHAHGYDSKAQPRSGPVRLEVDSPITANYNAAVPPVFLQGRVYRDGVGRKGSVSSDPFADPNSKF